MPTIKKVIIWGYSMYTHTHCFIHYGWHKAFKSLGYETHWFNDSNFPADFDFSNCLFISEGYADRNIPINNTSVYYISTCVNPEKYVSAGARLIDFRHNVKFFNDFSYDYTMDKSSLQKINDACYYDPNASDKVLKPKYQKNISGYEAIYLMFATDLLPDEINFDDINIPRTNKIYNVGSIWSGNYEEMHEFIEECRKNNIEFISKDPWREVTTPKDNKKLVQMSYIAPDIRGSGPVSDESITERAAHLYTGYVPCRIFKNISYGQLGATNSWGVNDLFQGRIVYNPSVAGLFYSAEKERNNKELIREQMEYVKSNHTYINRINSILSIL